MEASVKHSKTNTGQGRAGSLLLFLFGLPFAAAGIGLFLWMVVPALRDWQAMQDWQPVPAQLLAAELRENRDSDGATWEATARYRYVVDGREYESTRVAILAGSDNLGDFQSSLGNELERALRQGRDITVYVDPAEPASAVINRELRAGFVAFLSVFSAVFAVVGIGVMIAAFVTARRDDVASPAPERPWTTRAQWASPEITSSARGGAVAAWIFAFVWNALSLPATLEIPEELAGGNYAILAVLLFNVVGIGIVVWAIRQTWSQRKFGTLKLHMDPHPGAIGGDVAGYIDIPVAHDPAMLFRVSLNCLRIYTSGSGKQRSTRREGKWQDEKHLQAEPLDHRHVRLWFRFQPPAGLPVSQAPSDDYHAWTLDVAAEMPGLDLSRQFELPVFATGERSRQATASRVIESSAPDLAAVEQLSGFRQIPGGVAMNFRAGRHWIAGLVMLLVFGGGFGGGGYAVLNADVDIITTVFLGGILTLVGAACTLLGIWLLGNGLEVEADDLSVRIRRSLLGVPVRDVTLARGDIAGVGISRGATQTTGTRTIVYYDLVLQTKNGDVWEIGDGFRGAGQATLAGDGFARYARLPFLGEVSRGAAFAARKADYLARRGK